MKKNKHKLKKLSALVVVFCVLVGLSSSVFCQQKYNASADVASGKYINDLTQFGVIKEGNYYVLYADIYITHTGDFITEKKLVSTTPIVYEYVPAEAIRMYLSGEYVDIFDNDNWIYSNGVSKPCADWVLSNPTQYYVQLKIVLKPEYLINAHTLRLDYFARSGKDTIEQKDYSINLAPFLNVTPTQEDSYFTGWYRDEYCSVPYDNGWVDIINAPLIAGWRTVVPLPADPVREGYTFTGWYFDEDCIQPYDGSPIYSDTILYEGWQVKKYTVIFDSTGGGVIGSQVVEHFKKADKPIPTRIGYVFKGWITADGLLFDFDVTIAGDITLYAAWDILMLKVTFYVGGGVYAVIEVPYGSILQNATEIIDTATGQDTLWYYDELLTVHISNEAQLIGDVVLYSNFETDTDTDINTNIDTEKPDALSGAKTAIVTYALPIFGIAVVCIVLLIIFKARR